MEDGLPTGALSLEDNPTIVGITEKITDPPDPGDDDPTPEGTIEGSGGVRFVPIDALISTRKEERAKATAALSAKDTELAAAKEKAAKYDELAGYVEQARPIIERVRANPSLASDPPAKVETPKPMSEAEAVEYAKDFDLYKTDGTPDVDRAQRLVAREQARAEKAAQAAIAPFQANDVKRTSDAMFQHIAAFKDANGHQVDKGELTKIWEGIPAELSSQPNVAAILYDLALAASIRAGKYKGSQPPGPGAVVPTGSLGDGGKVRVELDQVGSKFARAADIKTADFEKTSARFKPGQVNSLE